MKKIILSSLFCFALYSLCAQDTWEIPLDSLFCNDECSFSPVRLLVNKDGNILVLNTMIIDSIGHIKQHISCFDDDGNFLWQKEYDFGVDEILYGWVTGPVSQNIYELENGALVSRGLFRENDIEQCYLFKMSGEGDSLLFKYSENFPYCSGGFQQIGISIFNGMRYSFSDNQFRLIEFDLDFNVLDQTLLEDSEGHRIMIIDGSNQNIFLMNNILGDLSYRKYDFSGNIINEVAGYEDVSRFTTYNNNGLLTAYDDDLVQFNEDLTERWYLPFEDILPSWPPHYVYSKVINATSDGGFILGGDASVDPFELVFLAKINENGTKDWGFVYDPFYLSTINTLSDVIETVGGYILLGRNSFTETTWLIKVDENGLLSDTNTPAATTSASMVSLFPNPASSFINLQFTRPFSGAIQVMDMSGRLLQQQSVDLTNTAILNIGDLPDGMYWVRLDDQATGAYEMLKFVKSLYR